MDSLRGLSARIEAKNIGKVEFFEPEVLIFPLSGIPPLITSLYIIYIKFFEDNNGVPGDEFGSYVQVTGNVEGWNERDFATEGLTV